MIFLLTLSSMSNFIVSRKLRSVYEELSIFVRDNWDNITEEENMKLFQKILNRGLPDWDNEIESAMFELFHGLTNKKISRGKYIDIHRDEKFFTLIRQSNYECMILWCRNHTIANWFNVTNRLFIQWIQETRKYEILLDKNKNDHSQKPLRRTLPYRRGRSNPYRSHPRPVSFHSRPHTAKKSFQVINRFDNLVDDDNFSTISESKDEQVVLDFDSNNAAIENEPNEINKVNETAPKKVQIDPEKDIDVYTLAGKICELGIN